MKLKGEGSTSVPRPDGSFTRLSPGWEMPRDFASEPGLQQPRVFGAIRKNKYGTYSVHYYMRALVPEEFHSPEEAMAYVEGELGEVIEAAGRLIGLEDE